MLKAGLFFLFIAGAGLCCNAQSESGFPRFDDIAEPLRMSPKPAVAVDRDGNWVINGKIRYLLGAQVPTLFGRNAFHSFPGENPDYVWLTGRAPDYQTCQRIGFDTLCSGNPMTYMKKRFPAFRYSLLESSSEGFVLEPGLPVLMDYTCAPWSNGRAGNRKGESFYHPEIDGVLPDDALVPAAQNVWVPYSVFHPAARKVYRAMWQSGAILAKEKQVPVLAYELFNEPMYQDRTPYARALFAETLRKKYGSVERMNRAWNSNYPGFEEAAKRPNLKENVGLFVEYQKFLEDGVVELCRFGKSVIREIDPSARFCIQLKGAWHYRSVAGSAMNLYKLNRIMEVVSVSTSGGIEPLEGAWQAPAKAVEAPSNPISLFDGVMQRHFYRALADGKPMQNQEMYVGKDYDEILSKLWLDHVRGSSACYIFCWGSGYPAWKTKNIEGAKRNAEAGAYTMLNPCAVNPKNLPAIFQAKKEIFKFGEFFMSRADSTPREIAVLFSHPTERASGATGNPLKKEFAAYGGALEFSHYPVDVLMEEQLAENRQNRYKVIVAAGVRNTAPETVPALSDFVKNGGILILGREFMEDNEFGIREDRWNGIMDGLRWKDAFESSPVLIKTSLEQPSNLRGGLTMRNTRIVTDAPGWESLASDGKNPVLLRKPYGKGFVYLLTGEMPDYALASMLGSVLNKHGIHPHVVLKNADNGDLPLNVELHAARKNGRTAYFLYNFDAYPKLVTLESAALKQNPHFLDLIDNRSLPVSDGKAMLLVKPKVRMIFGVGTEKEFAEFGTFPVRSAAEHRNEFERLIKERDERLGAKRQAQFQYTPDLSKTVTLNLRDAANSSFSDPTPPGDGKGGWTDQGRESSLEGVPWGTRRLLGVPCEIIRFDENGDRTCVILKSKSLKRELPEQVSIPVNDTLKALYFFHTAAWVPRGKKIKAMDYVIEYRSGKKLEIPVVTGENIWDWYGIRDPKRVEAAWKNLDRNGFYCWRWENPFPNDPIRGVVLRSANGTVIPIVIAITAERFDAKSDVALKIYGYGGFRGVKANGEYRLLPTSALRRFAGGVISHPTAYIPAEFGKNAVLKFDVRGGLDLCGARREGQPVEISLNRAGANGVKLFTGKRLFLNPYLPRKKMEREYQTVTIPVAALAPGKDCNQLDFRIRAEIPESGIDVRNIRVEKTAATSK